MPEPVSTETPLARQTTSAAHAAGEPLFEQCGDTDHRCTRCGAINTRKSDSFPSFGGTIDWWERCTACGASVSGCNMSAVL